YLSLTLAGPLLTLYASSLYPAHFRKVINWLLLGVASVFSIIILVTPKSFFTHFILPLEILVLLSSLYTIFMLIYGYFKVKDRHILYSLSGLGFLLLSIVFAIVDNEISFMFQSAAGIFFVFILYQAFLQAYIFSNAFNEIDYLSEQKNKLEKRNVELFSLSYIDNLTETCNRRLMDDFLSSNWRVNAFSERTVGIILIDIDDFSNYNNLYGHKQGDACLVKVCDLLRDELSLLGQDTLARYGGEEFAVIVSDMDEKNLYQTAERLRKAVESGGIEHPSSNVLDVVTISIGCANMIPSRDKMPDKLLDAAAKALFEAKNLGKNNTRFYKTQLSAHKWEPRLV
ncbi:MAG: GGDEF domain-containing protein, partial [Spirochaetaceae bacterium]|nr:GGDEF domain-containing protein [Spirochaetaceae bacterium]